MPSIASEFPERIHFRQSGGMEQASRGIFDSRAAPSEAEAQEYCRRLARSHYENFSVASWFLPQRLRQHFFNVYAYCRIADDLGDEVGDPAASLQLLDEWQAELDACYAGNPRHPVFVALAQTVRKFDIPQEPFADLLQAFRQDQTVTRYETFEDLLGYCRYSANPVGHWFFTCAGIAIRSARRFPTSPAPHCSWRTFGRTSARIT